MELDASPHHAPFHLVDVPIESRTFSCPFHKGCASQMNADAQEESCGKKATERLSRATQPRPLLHVGWVGRMHGHGRGVEDRSGATWFVISFPMEREGHPVILGIESSCDDTSAAVICGPNVLSNVVANQALHAEFGGVVPEWASRAHLSKIHPVVHAALAKAGIKLEKVDAVAYTLGPGLQGSLHVGASYAKALAWAANVPAIPVHHMRAHILAHVLEPGKPPAFPFLCLTVSGGHTQLVLVHSPGRMEVLGQTLDDAAGEAFDKVAKLIGLPYPGGPLVDKLATEGNPEAFSFTRPQMDGYNWSFSGLKTQVLHFLTKQQRSDPTFVERHKADICASVQAAILDMLMGPLQRAVVDTGIAEVAIAGGVSANSGLRKRLAQASEEKGWTVHIPPMAYCTDNAAMIAAVGWVDAIEQRAGRLSDAPSPRLPELVSLAQLQS